jgi:hypothetical protein
MSALLLMLVWSQPYTYADLPIEAAPVLNMCWRGT